MTFRRSDLEPFDVAREIRIETALPDGPAHSTIIWVLVDGEQLYVRSVNGVTARWYREALANPSVTLVQGTRLPATAVTVRDEAGIERVSQLLLAKYPGEDGLAEMLTPEAEAATFRLEPRS